MKRPSNLAIAGMCHQAFGNPIPPEAYVLAGIIMASLEKINPTDCASTQEPVDNGLGPVPVYPKAPECMFCDEPEGELMSHHQGGLCCARCYQEQCDINNMMQAEEPAAPVEAYRVGQTHPSAKWAAQKIALQNIPGE